MRSLVRRFAPVRSRSFVALRYASHTTRPHRLAAQIIDRSFSYLILNETSARVSRQCSTRNRTKRFQFGMGEGEYFCADMPMQSLNDDVGIQKRLLGPVIGC
jgi:hypothetical protein